MSGVVFLDVFVLLSLNRHLGVGLVLRALGTPFRAVWSRFRRVPGHMWFGVTPPLFRYPKQWPKAASEA